MLEMAVGSKTRNLLEGLVREGSFNWLLGKRNSFDEEFEEMGRSPSAQRNWIPQLSPLANLVLRRCSKVLGVPPIELQESFNAEAAESIKHPSRYARNLLEYCCFRTLALSIRVTGHLADKKFRRLTYDMMLAWEVPAAASQPLLNVEEDASVGVEAFSRIASAVPIIANVVISENLFEVLTKSTGGRLQFSIYEKYLSGLERVIRKMKNQSESSLISSVRSARGEKILEVDGTVTSQPVLEHIGMSAWPGRLVLTDHALYFEALRVVSYDKAKMYDLADDLKQVVKPEMTGPWGTRLFDKAVSYKSISLSESVVFEFPELKGHTRRDYWLGIIREILYVHRFINKYQIKGVEREEALSKAVLGILRVQAIQDISLANPLRELDRTNNSKAGGEMHSVSALDMVSNLGFVFGTSSNNPNEAGLLVGEITVGELSSLERAVKESKINYEKVVLAQQTVDGVKVDGIDTNLAVMKELLSPMRELGKYLLSLAFWDDHVKSLVFCLLFSYVIFRGWLGYTFALVLIFIAIFMVLNRFCGQGKSVDGVKVIVPPATNTMEQLLAVQNAISQIEGIVQDGNILLLKMRALLMCIFPQASQKFAAMLLIAALILAFVPSKLIILLIFLETFTRYSPPRKASTERWMRRLREWWFSIPAAPVVLEREREEKKRK
ncbi:hypothetical protein CIPAW_16G087100 [Carya illinoinensis]|uniref:Uncharacterized protein n=1 Tax=Carya illinoinensis TaxID=32201 RepID=A0A8T1N2K6_CARIL|nr:hypothetical protein CIPAW_16G087100 [Carya illinoinensis]